MTDKKIFTIDELSNGEYICYINGKVVDSAVLILSKYIYYKYLNETMTDTDAIYEADEKIKKYLVFPGLSQETFTESQLNLVKWFKTEKDDVRDNDIKEQFLNLKRDIDTLEEELNEEIIPRYNKIKALYQSCREEINRKRNKLDSLIKEIENL